MREKYAVSGSHGFLGGKLFKHLEQSQCDVARLDRTGSVPEGSTVVFDLASFGNYHDQTDPHKIYEANVTRVVSLLDSARNAKAIVLTSSSAVDLPVKTFYTSSKMAVEQLAQAWVHETGQSVVVARPSSITGVGEQPRHLIPKLIDSCLNGTEMPFVGEPKHDYLDVDDFVRGVLLIARNAEKYRGHVFNVSSGVQTSNELVRQIVESITGKQPNLSRVKSMRRYDADDWVVSNSKLGKLGWTPRKDLWESVNEMVNYERENIRN